MPQACLFQLPSQDASIGTTADATVLVSVATNEKKSAEAVRWHTVDTLLAIK